jgi:hypothetical protein
MFFCNKITDHKTLTNYSLFLLYDRIVNSNNKLYYAAKETPLPPYKCKKKVNFIQYPFGILLFLSDIFSAQKLLIAK